MKPIEKQQLTYSAIKAQLLQRKSNAFESGVEKKWLVKAYQTFEKGEKIVANTYAH